MLSMIASKTVPLAVALAAESKYVPSDLNGRLFGLVILSNFVASSFTIVLLGSKVGAARTKYNVPYPNMYAVGDSEDAKKFNSIQRSHQQALETHHMFLGLSLITGIRFPVTTAALGALYCVARRKWAELYSSEGPEKRYGSWLAKEVWTPLVALTLTSVFVAGELLAGYRTNAFQF